MTPTDVAHEVDRQLAEQRAQADAFATRAGVLIATSSLVTGLLATNTIDDESLTTPLIVIAASTVVGVVVLGLGRLAPGPAASQLGRLSANTSADGNVLMDAKILLVEANARALLRTEVVFGLQVLMTTGGLVALLFALIGGQ